MRGIKVAVASAAVVVFGGVSGAVAADLDTMPAKEPVYKALPGPTTCTNVVDFFATACQLAWYGVRFYGTIDVGYGYQTHGAPFDKLQGWGVDYLLGKPNRAGMWLQSPNALGPSNVGIQVKEPLGAGWSFIGQLQTNFDPYSMRLSDNPGSLRENIGVPTAFQTSNGDASPNGKFYNAIGIAGVSNDTWGTLTFGRQFDLGGDAILSYDPMGSAPGFSVIGYSGAVAGGGDTEQKVATTSVKYRVKYGNFRFAAFGQFGGYDQGNSSQGQYQGDIGADFHVGPGLLSVDAIGGYTRDGVLLTLTSAASPVLQATISNNTNVMAVAKYTLDRLQLFAGYEWIDFAPPSDATIKSLTDISGDQIGLGGLPNTAVVTSSFNAKDKVQQIMWAGARYAFTDSLDVAAAYYRYDQQQYATGSAVGTCAGNATALPSCAGSLNAASVLLDWKFAPKWDTYIGTFYSEMNGGIGNGNLSHNNLATTGGLRFRW
jgi:predicted porin